MLLREAKEILKNNGYLIEKVDVDFNYKGPRGSAQLIVDGKTYTKKDFKNSDWQKLTSLIDKYNKLYPKFEEFLKMPIEDFTYDTLREFYKVYSKCKEQEFGIRYILKKAGFEVDRSENIEELYREKRDTITEFTKKEIEEKTDLIYVSKSDHECGWPGFEKAFVINVDWANKTFYKWRGYCAFLDLSDIPDLKMVSGGRAELSVDNINKIGDWLNDNKDLVEKEMKKGKDYFDDVAEDQARYYKDHPNGNWSGD